VTLDRAYCRHVRVGHRPGNRAAVYDARALAEAREISALQCAPCARATSEAWNALGGSRYRYTLLPARDARKMYPDPPPNPGHDAEVSASTYLQSRITQSHAQLPRAATDRAHTVVRHRSCLCGPLGSHVRSLVLPPSPTVNKL